MPVTLHLGLCVRNIVGPREIQAFFGGCRAGQRARGDTPKTRSGVSEVMVFPEDLTLRR